MTKILVTDGLGFIGSNLVSELRERGHEVWVCDLGHSSGPHYIRCDVNKYHQLERIFEQHHFDYIYHLAAEYGRWNGEDYYEDLWQTNAIGTKHLIRLQEKLNFRIIFFYSTDKGHKRIINFVEDSCRTLANIVDNFIPGEVYNAAGRTEWEMEIKEYFDLILHAVGRDDSIVTYKESEPFTTRVKTIDCSKAVMNLRYDPKISPEEGIKGRWNG